MIFTENADVYGELSSEWWADRLMQDNRQSGGREVFGMEQFGEEEKNDIIAMLNAMTAFRPGKRLTADEVLESKWMRKWALPEVKKMGKFQ